MKGSSRHLVGDKQPKETLGKGLSTRDSFGELVLESHSEFMQGERGTAVEMSVERL